MAEIVKVGAADAAGAQLDARHAVAKWPERARDDAKVFGPEERGGVGGVGHWVCLEWHGNRQ